MRARPRLNKRQGHMASRSDGNKYSVKIDKLQGLDDYATWCGDFRILLRASDPEMLGIEQEPLSNTTAARSVRRKAASNAKATFVLNLVPVVKVNVRFFIEDEEEPKNAKKLWDNLKETYTATNTQAVQNIRNELDALRYQEGKIRDFHIDKFNRMVAKMATYGKNISDEDKMALIMRSLPESFAPITITLSSVGLGFTQFLDSIRSEVDRLKSKHGEPCQNPILTPGAQAKKSQAKKSLFKGNCHYCGKSGHMKRNCRKKMADESGQGRGRGRGRGRSGGHWQHQGWNGDQDWNQEQYGSQEQQQDQFQGSWGGGWKR